MDHSAADSLATSGTSTDFREGPIGFDVKCK
jgi:hypothetical protein